MPKRVQADSGAAVSGQAARPRLVFGTGNYARIAATILADDCGITVPAFVVDAEYAPDLTTLLSRPVLTIEAALEAYPPHRADMLVAMGYGGLNRNRQAVFERMQELGYAMPAVIHPTATVARSAHVGQNSFVFEQGVVQPFAKVGENVVLWSGGRICHDSTIEDHCFIASQVVVSGHATIGHHSFVGANATIRDGITVGPSNIIGAAALVMKNTSARAVHSVRYTPAHEKTSDQFDF